MILHIDMDAFYASVEELDNPELKGRPVIVGGSPQSRGVVSAANYIARGFGVHSAMPTANAHRLCPQGVFLPVRMARYIEISQQIHAIFHRYTPLIEPLSLDEAFLDVRASESLFGSAEQIGKKIQDEIAHELGLVASVGIAPNKFLAKIASDLEKPNGFVIVRSEQVQSFLDPLPIRRLWGVGKSSAQRLHSLGLYTIQDIRETSVQELERVLGNRGEYLWQLAHGRDNRPLVTDREVKSISHETTFSEDIADEALLVSQLLHLTEQVAWRLRRHGLKGKTIQLKLRYSDFRSLTRSLTLDSPTDNTDTLWQNVERLFMQRIPRPLPAVRLIGIGVSSFEQQYEPQPDLFSEQEEENNPVVDQLSDAIRKRFGKSGLQRARGLKPSDK
ncbi:MAG: DNA polymerase IV [Gammaproteobacteria bacterium]|nr:DNA polymerase IV [Gammaproteobacteria bacterium]